MLHAFFVGQLNQSTLVRSGKQRTDDGYYQEMRKMIKKIIAIVEDEH